MGMFGGKMNNSKVLVYATHKLTRVYRRMRHLAARNPETTYNVVGGNIIRTRKVYNKKDLAAVQAVGRTYVMPNGPITPIPEG